MSLKLGPNGKLLLKNGKITDDIDCCCAPVCDGEKVNSATLTVAGFSVISNCVVNFTSGVCNGLPQRKIEYFYASLNGSYSTTVFVSKASGGVTAKFLLGGSLGHSDAGVLVGRQTIYSSPTCAPSSKLEYFCNYIQVSSTCCMPAVNNLGATIYPAANCYEINGCRVDVANSPVFQIIAFQSVPPFTTWTAVTPGDGVFRASPFLFNNTPGTLTSDACDPFSSSYANSSVAVSKTGLVDSLTNPCGTYDLVRDSLTTLALHQ